MVPNLDEMAKRKLVIDCDAGVDDAQAILLALAQDVEVLAITCVAGNTLVNQVCENVLKVLEVCGRTDIPVYKGASGPLLGTNRKAGTFSRTIPCQERFLSSSWYWQPRKKLNQSMHI